MHFCQSTVHWPWMKRLRTMRGWKLPTVRGKWSKAIIMLPQLLEMVSMMTSASSSTMHTYVFVSKWQFPSIQCICSGNVPKWVESGFNSCFGSTFTRWCQHASICHSRIFHHLRVHSNVRPEAEWIRQQNAKFGKTKKMKQFWMRQAEWKEIFDQNTDGMWHSNCPIHLFIRKHINFFCEFFDFLFSPPLNGHNFW